MHLLAPTEIVLLTCLNTSGSVVIGLYSRDYIVDRKTLIFTLASGSFKSAVIDVVWICGSIVHCLNQQ